MSAQKVWRFESTTTPHPNRCATIAATQQPSQSLINNEAQGPCTCTCTCKWSCHGNRWSAVSQFEAVITVAKAAKLPCSCYLFLLLRLVSIAALLGQDRNCLVTCEATRCLIVGVSQSGTRDRAGTTTNISVRRRPGISFHLWGSSETLQSFPCSLLAVIPKSRFFTTP